MLTFAVGLALGSFSDFEPTSSYSKNLIEGFTVRISRHAKAAPDELDPAMALLKLRLVEVVRMVPSESLGVLRKIEIWIERNEPRFPCACYHDDVNWLKGNGFNPDKVNSVEIANLKNFVGWSFDQPLMLFHELAHGYHDAKYGFEGLFVKDAYEAAIEEKLYDEVSYFRGQKKKAYAATNQMEYFAELSEALFGYNDFFPFVRPELEAHDPRGYKMVCEAWGVKG